MVRPRRQLGDDLPQGFVGLVAWTFSTVCPRTPFTNVSCDSPLSCMLYHYLYECLQADTLTRLEPYPQPTNIEESTAPYRRSFLYRLGSVRIATTQRARASFFRAISAPLLSSAHPGWFGRPKVVLWIRLARSKCSTLRAIHMR